VTVQRSESEANEQTIAGQTHTSKCDSSKVRIGGKWTNHCWTNTHE